MQPLSAAVARHHRTAPKPPVRAPPVALVERANAGSAGWTTAPVAARPLRHQCCLADVRAGQRCLSGNQSGVGGKLRLLQSQILSHAREALGPTSGRSP